MNDTQRGYVATLVIIIILLVLGLGGLSLYQKIKGPETGPLTVATSTNQGTGQQYASKCGLTIESPTVGSAVSFPVTISGSINNTDPSKIGCSWQMFEGQAGVAKLYYETKDGYSLAVDTQPIKVDNWTSTSTTFSTTLKFDNKKESFPSGYNFKVVLTEEDAAGNGNADSAELPLVLK